MREPTYVYRKGIGWTASLEPRILVPSEVKLGAWVQAEACGPGTSYRIPEECAGWTYLGKVYTRDLQIGDLCVINRTKVRQVVRRDDWSKALKGISYYVDNTQPPNLNAPFTMSYYLHVFRP